MNVVSALDLQVILCEKVGWKVEDFENNFDVEEYEDYCILKQKGYLVRQVWSRIFDAIKELNGRYLVGLRAFEVPFTPKEDMGAHQKMQHNLQANREAGQQITKENVGQTQSTVLIQKSKEEEIEEVIQKVKEILKELHLKTFNKYREAGKEIIKAGYEHEWRSKHRKKALEEWAISQQTFSIITRIGKLSEEEFTNAVSNFPSVHAWVNRSQLGEKVESPPMPFGKYDIVYADPPWRYNVSHLRGSPENHYPTMSLDEICNLKIPASENAVLFLWATNPMVEDALKVMETWGFKYKTNLVWVKDKFGVGFWFRGQHELLLVGVKGDVHAPEESNRFSSVLEAPIKEHSEKPTQVYELIEKMYPNGHYLELFARNKRPRWEAWGNEV